MDKIRSLALILALLVLSAYASTACAVEVVKTVPFDCAPTMVYDSFKGAVWVVPTYIAGYFVMDIPFYRSTNSVVAISGNDSSVLANFTLGGSPVVFDSVLNEVYVVVGNEVSVISDVSNSVIATIEANTSLAGGPSGWVYDSGKGEMFTITNNQTCNYTSGVTNYTYGVTVISCITKQVVASIPLGNYPAPQGLTYDSAKGEIYVSYQSYNEQKPENFISVISDSNNSVIATIPLGNSTRWVGSGAYDSATGEIYLPASNDAVLVVSDKTHTVVDSIACPNGAFGSNIGIAYDPVKSVIFVGALDGKIRIISDRTHSVVETILVSSDALVYDSVQNVMISKSDRGLEFISDASLPDPPPTPTPTPTASPTPSLHNPVFLDLDWVQLAILVAMGIIAVAAGVAAFRFLRKDKAQKQSMQE